MNRQPDDSSEMIDISSSSTPGASWHITSDGVSEPAPRAAHETAAAHAAADNSSEAVQNAVPDADETGETAHTHGEDGGHKSKTTLPDVDGYVFTSGKVKKKKRTVHEGVYGDSDDLFLQSHTTNAAKRKHRHHHHHHRNGRRKMKTWKKVLLSVGCVLLGLIVVAVGTLAYLVYRGSTELFNTDIHVTAPDGVDTQENGKYIVYNGDTYEFNENITSILFMGVDTRDIYQSEDASVYGTSGQADVLVLASIDTSTGEISLVNISRDTMIDVAVYSAGGSYVGTENMQICLSYAYGDGKEKSCENTVNSVQRLFYNLPINTYFSLDLDGISVINDSVGGVDVVSPETIGEFTEGESYHLEGDQAENFVRSRDSEKIDANSMRMERQKVYIQSFVDTVFAQTKTDISTPINLYNATADYSCTNLDPSRVVYFARQAMSNGVNGVDMYTVPGTVTAGEKYAEFNVNEQEFYEMFLSLYYTKIS